MSRQRRGHPPDPGIPSPSQSIAAHTTSVLDAIEVHTSVLSFRANSEIGSPYLQTLSHKSTYIWNQIRFLSQTAPMELLCIWVRVEDYERLIHGIADGISSGTMTEAETNSFIFRLSDFVHEFEQRSRSPCRSTSDLTSAPSFFRNTSEMHISHSNFHMNNSHQAIDPGQSNHLKRVEYILIFIQTTVLF